MSKTEFLKKSNRNIEKFLNCFKYFLFKDIKLKRMSLIIFIEVESMLLWFCQCINSLLKILESWSWFQFPPPGSLGEALTFTALIRQNRLHTKNTTPAGSNNNILFTIMLTFKTFQCLVLCLNATYPTATSLLTENRPKTSVRFC